MRVSPDDTGLTTSVSDRPCESHVTTCVRHVSGLTTRRSTRQPWEVRTGSHRQRNPGRLPPPLHSGASSSRSTGTSRPGFSISPHLAGPLRTATKVSLSERSPAGSSLQPTGRVNMGWNQPLSNSRRMRCSQPRMAGQ